MAVTGTLPWLDDTTWVPSAPRSRTRLLVTGIVQGVGFRPFVFRTARRTGLSGFVRNTSDGVEIEVEGAADSVAAFPQQLRTEAPPLARITDIVIATQALQSDTAFEIRESRPAAGRSSVPPDVGLCDRCRQELHDPSNRRFRHPFITCTDCGPRFTIIGALPYDRPATTMAAFAMCARCQAEYASPEGRRHHAEPIACHECGPRVWLEPAGSAERTAQGDNALRAAVRLLADGAVLGVKGIGGFHLVCDATRADAVSRLRARKHRPHKPFAVAVWDPARADRLAEWSPPARAALTSAARPIVLVDARADHDLADEVAPGLRQLGVMLPHAPLHELLLADWARRCDARSEGASGALVMTSGNRAEEPVVIAADEARARLAGVVDAWLMHDRAILVRCDDAIVADAGLPVPLPIRRSRGFSPAPLPLAFARRPVLAVGGELKAACCLALDGQALPGPHVGDMEHAESLDAFSAAVDHLCRVFHAEPELYVCDAHPGYLSGHWAKEAADGRLLRVQHHHAHAASVMAEHGLGLDDELLTVCFDGTGYGSDGAIWGGEVLAARYERFERVAQLAYAPLAGGDAAARQPARLALGYLAAANVPWDLALPAVAACTPAERQMVADQLRRGASVVQTSSMGRLFDVVAALTGVCSRASYEGQAAMALEALAHDGPGVSSRYRFEWIGRQAGPIVIDWRPVVRAVAADATRGVGADVISVAFHDAVAALVGGLVAHLLTGHVSRRVGLTGGVFQNPRLLAGAVRALAAQGVDVLTHRVVPPNDGGLALGQAAIGAARLARLDRR